MKNLLLISILLLFTYLNAVGQINQPGIPPGFSLPKDKDEIPFVKMPAVDVEKLLEEDLVFDNLADTPWRFGENITVSYSLENSGVWKDLENGGKLWQLGILSEGALSINLTFNKYILPKGAQLYIYNIDRTEVIGAFTDYNNQEDYYFATTLVRGEKVIIEYYEPKDAEFKGELSLETVTHGYRSPFDYVKGFGHSGSCNLNVACAEAEEWQDQVNSTVLLLTGSNAFCSGSIINNTRQDYTPFVLSANHCYKDPSTVVVWFNWQSESCSNPPSSPVYQSMSGATQRARNNTTDFWLFELNHQIPEGYNPFFAGWNRTMEASLEETIIGVHHPRGDIKKFSYALEGVNAAAYLNYNGSGITHWRIKWSGGTTTEPGSSGSPLFDAQGRIIGQLHGGYAACGNIQPDWYGRLGLSWTGGETDSSRLSNWLDADNLNLEVIEGIYITPEVVNNPPRFKATTIAESEIMLAWKTNANNNNILIAYNTEKSFGIPSGPYSLGDEIDGGGKIIYLGNGDSFFHNELANNQGYYYKAWSFNDLLTYSDGVSAFATTYCGIISEFPHFEGFEEGVPACWKQNIVSGNTKWQIGKGNEEGIPEGAYSGMYNLFFKTEDENNIAKVIIPNIYFGGYDYGSVSFYYTNASTCTQDRLKVLYRVDENSEWALLDVFFSNVTKWTYAEIILPEVSKSTQLAFEATSFGGNGICVDHITIDAHYYATFPAPMNLSVVGTDNHNIHLQWEAPAYRGSAIFSAYNIYRNNAFIAQVDDVSEYVDEGLAIGEYEYFVTAVYKYPYGESQPSNTVSAEIIADNPFALFLQIEGDGIVYPEVGTHYFNSGAIVKIKATADNHWYFSGFMESLTIISTDEEHFITIDGDRNITAVFSAIDYNITLSSNPSGMGTQTGGGLYNYGQLASISTTLPLGYSFVHWKDDEKIISTKKDIQWFVNNDVNLTAFFKPNQYTIKLYASPAEGGSVFGGGNKEYGAEVTIYAEENEEWVFSHWKEGSEIVSTNSEYTFTVSSNHSFTAVFDVKSFVENLSNKEKEISIYPNPAFNRVNISFSGISGDVEINIFNLSGQKLISQKTELNTNSNQSKEIDISNLKPGVYIISISESDQTHQRKLIVR